MTLRVGWYTTARGAGSRGMFEAAVEAIQLGTLDAEIAFVFCNRERGEDPATDGFLDRVMEIGIPLRTLSSVGFRRAHGGGRSRPGEPLPAWRERYDAEVARLVDPFDSTIGVLAGYMLIFSGPFVREHPLLNLHPALPDGPIGTWREVIRTLIRTSAVESGVMMNLAIPEVDAGPVATFCRYPLSGAPFDGLRVAGTANASDETLEASPLFAAIREAGLRREAAFLLATLQALAEGRVRVDGGRVLDASGAVTPPLDLTTEVEARLTTQRA